MLHMNGLNCFQRKYFVKFSMDGARVGHKRGGVAASVKIFDTNRYGKPKEFTHHERTHLQDDIPVLYYFGRTHLSRSMTLKFQLYI